MALAPTCYDPADPNYIGDAEVKRHQQWGEIYDSAFRAYRRERDPEKLSRLGEIVGLMGPAPQSLIDKYIDPANRWWER